MKLRMAIRRLLACIAERQMDDVGRFSEEGDTAFNCFAIASSVSAVADATTRR